MVNAPALLTLVQRVLLTPMPRTLPHPPTAKLVLVGLALHADPGGGRAYPSRERLAALCDVSPRTVDRVLHDLAACGYLAEQAPPTFKQPRIWRLLLETSESRLLEWQFSGWQIDETPPTDRQSSPLESAAVPSICYRSSTSTRTSTRTRAEEAVESVETVENGVEPVDVAAVAARNQPVITKIAHTVFDLIGVSASFSHVVEAVVERCRHDKILQTRDVVQRAVATALIARVGRPTDPLARHVVRDLTRRSS